jgi:hypothetical protein
MVWKYNVRISVGLCWELYVREEQEPMMVAGWVGSVENV